jgi:hypothetical protein
LTAILTALAFCAFFFSGPIAAEAADFPLAQLDEAERHYTEAYTRFLDRDYWGTLDFLERALRANTYLVDYYLLRGLAMNRIGDYGEGREALAYYMEVRPMDSTAPRIFSRAIAQQRDMRLIAGAFPLAARWRFSRIDPQTEFNQGFFRPYSVKGLGKADAGGSVFCLSDTLGDAVYVCPAEGEVKTLRLESPAVTLPMGDGSFYVLTTSGDVHSFTAFAEEPLSADFRGSIGSVVADGTLLSANEFAVADPVAREIVFYSFQTLTRTGSWSPPENAGPMLFEPVAVAAYGPWLAVADRGNDRVLFLDTRRRDFFSAPVSRPRDVLWTSLGELFAVGEDGLLTRTVADFQSRSAEVPDIMERDVQDGWTLFNSPEGDVYCLDVGASKLWRGQPLPDVNTSSAFLSVFRPRIDLAENRESFVLDATLTSPFTSYAKDASLVVYSVWNDRTIPSYASWRNEEEASPAVPLFFHRPAPPGFVSPALENRVVENGTDIQIALPSIWSARKDVLTNLLIDSSILFSQDELDALALFCLNNGVEMDIWARTVPTVEMLRAGAFTGGRVVWSAANPPNLKAPRNKVQIRIPLPQELSSSGYPSRSMLTVYLDFGLIQTRDWIPLWPDLIE